MNPERVVRSEVKTLTDLPNVGPAIAGQLATIGICTPAELRGREPLELFEALCARSGRRLDPCLLDVLLSIADFIDGGDPRETDPDGTTSDVGSTGGEDAAGVDAVVVPRHGAAGLGPTVSKVAAGAAESLPFATVANVGRVLEWLADYGVTRIGTSDRADASLYDTALDGHLALVMGREETGLGKGIAARCDQLVRLPMTGTVSSLNVSVAAGVCLYEALRQRR